MRSVRAVATAALVLILSPGISAAADIRVLSVGSVQIATKIIAAEFEKSTGHKVLFTIVSPDRIAGQLANAPFDMLIASVPVIEALDKTGGIRAGTRTPLARAGIGVMVRDGAPVPDVATPAAFTKTLLAARSIVHGDPMLPNQSGVVTMRILAKAGILDAVRPKARAAGLAEGLAMVAKGEVELALFNQVELPAGVRLAGAVPVPLQDYTFYEVALLANGAVPDEARHFIGRMTSPTARKTWEAALLDAYPYR
ncbi:MAG: substrate-binding domain-containing protein [Xanthobacteraceae bacterium]|nr:substrate-binding domain-containing protein [Xanthobacteraceae bacterium]